MAKTVSYYAEFAIGTIVVLISARLWQDAITKTLDEKYEDSLKVKYLAAALSTFTAIAAMWVIFYRTGSFKALKI